MQWQVLMMTLVMTSVAASPKVRRQVSTTPDYTPCNGNLGLCVPYYLCNEGDIVTDGVGLIDIRIRDEIEDGVRSTSECPNFLDVCCNRPETNPITPDIPAYQPACGHHNPSGVHVRIAGQGFQDTETQFAEFPWMAAILRSEQVGPKSVNLYRCGGSLIHPSVVLTAAHCVADLNVNNLIVRLGEWDTQRTDYEIFPHQNINVARVLIHEDYRPGPVFNDYALLFLERPATIAPNVDTICLPHFDENLIRSSCFASGWGKDKFEKDGVYQNVLKKVQLDMVGSGDCQQRLRERTRLGNYFLLDNSFTCAGGVAGVDTCTGDGGSPLVCQSGTNPGVYFQTGIVAWGIGCGEGGVPAVYADVTKASDWIKYNADLILKEMGYYIENYWN